jgi:hypothetical protein
MTIRAGQKLCHLLHARESSRRCKRRSIMITANQRLAAAAEGEALSIGETRVFQACAVAAQPKAVAAGRRR